jgi:hypothetical protein
MKLTARNVQAVPERLHHVLPQVFEQLVDPDFDEMALHNYALSPTLFSFFFSFGRPEVCMYVRN